MSKFFFFTDIDLFNPQTQEQAFGPVAGSENTQYRVTSLHSATNDSYAYAVCDSIAFVQEISSDLVSIILKPIQTNHHYSSRIKYFIYKGIKKSSLVDGSTIEPFTIDKVIPSYLKVIKISQDFKNLAYDENNKIPTGTTKTKATQNAIGLNFNASATSNNVISDNVLLDAIFQKKDIDQFPKVNSGAVLGIFDKMSIGFEVVVNEVGKGITFGDVRKLDNKITFDPNVTSPVEKFHEKTKQEKILNYIDPCSFFSSFYIPKEEETYTKTKQKATNLKGYNNNLVESSFVLTNEMLYNNILQKYVTKNIVYFDIRNQFNHSLNYYQNYNTSQNYADIKVGYDGNNAETIQYKDDYGWPILRINTSVFNRVHNWKPSSITVKLPIKDNISPYIYLANGYFYNNFPILEKSLRPSMEDTVDIGFTISTAFGIPKFDNAITIPYYVKINYFKKIIANQNNEGNLLLEVSHYVDNLFDLNRLVNENGPMIPLISSDTTKWVCGVDDVFVDETANYGSCYVAQSGIAQDINTVTFFALRQNDNFITNSANTVFNNIIGENLPYFKNTSCIKDYINTTATTTQQTSSYNLLPDDLFSGTEQNKLYQDGRDLIMVTISNFELTTIQDKMKLIDDVCDKRLGLIYTSQVDVNNKEYYRYEIVVRGYNTIEQTTIAKFISPTGIYINKTTISNTNRIFISEGASVYMDDVDSIEQNRKNFASSYTAIDSLVNIRNTANTNDDSNILFKVNGKQKFRILYKQSQEQIFYTEDTNYTRTYVWYKVEWKDTILCFKPGNKTEENAENLKPYSPNIGWIRRNAPDNNLFERLFYPVATFEKFIKDLQTLMKEMDNNSVFANDSYQMRITRLRQMTKESDSGVMGSIIGISTYFDKVIGSTTDDPIRLDNIEETFDSNNISYNIQLFVDYMGIEMANGKVIDLHHLFVGLDVINHQTYHKGIVLGANILPSDLTLDNNVDSATWAGDIGAAPSDFINKIDSIVVKIKQNASLSQEVKDSIMKSHYYETRGKDEDLLGDIYPHQVNLLVAKYKSKNTDFKDVQRALYELNNQLQHGNDSFIFKTFLKYLNGVICHLGYPILLDYFTKEIFEFSKIWYRRTYLSNLIIPDDIKNSLNEISEKYANRFNDWLNENTK